MKKIFIALALVASITFASAQVKSESAAKSALDAAQAAANNAKKATKVATWLKLASSYMDAYAAPAGNGWVGGQAQELQLVMGNQKPSSEENVEVNGVQYLKKSYSSADYYFNANNQLAVIKVTKPIVEGALEKALEAYRKAFAVDTKGTKKEDIIKGIQTVSEKLVQEAYDAYTFGDNVTASKYFEAAAQALASEPVGKEDYEYVYDAGFTALESGDPQRARTLLEKCVSNEYYGEGGEVFSKLADALDKLGDKEGSKDVLEKGFAAFPESQGILIGLINYYISSGENTDKLFSLLDNAKKNEPDNASLYYVEGNIYKEIGNNEAALASYRKCADINPDYEYGYIGEALLQYNIAFDIQEKAQQEFDDAKYMALVEQFDTALKSCIAPFEKALGITKDDALKTSIAEYLKNACYRFRESDPSYAEKYEKYNKMSAGE